MGGVVEGAASGAPWWLVVLLPIASALVTHHLTLARERIKGNRDWHARWHSEVKGLVTKVSNAAIQHYVDTDSVTKTAVSAGLIISEIRRLRSSVHESNCMYPSDSKITTDALRAFDDAITAQDDFQDQGRKTRNANDGVCTMIRSSEQVLLGALLKPRTQRAH